MKKSQAAMEFLMTYGWAMMIVIIAMAALAMFGIFRVGFFIPERIQLTPGLDVVDFRVDENSITIIMFNNLGKNIEEFYIHAVKCGDDESMIPLFISAGEKKKFLVYCNDPGIVRSRFKSRLEVSYVDGDLQKSLKGSIDGTVNKGKSCVPRGDGLLNPRVLCDCQGLQDMNYHLGWSYVLEGDIDCNGFDAGDGKGFDPVGDDVNWFSGRLDGKGHVIDGLSIDRSDEDYVGLFGYTNGAEIEMLGLTNIDIIGYEYVGAIAGKHNGLFVRDCFVLDGNVKGDGYVGGFIGTNNYDKEIKNSYSVSSVTRAVNGNAGRLFVGDNTGTIINSFASENGVCTNCDDDLFTIPVANLKSETFIKTNYFWSTSIWYFERDEYPVLVKS